MFSGKSWKELEDIFPANVKIASEAYKIISVFYPALVSTRQWLKATYGIEIQTRDLFLLCWLQRCEDARENVSFDGWPALKGMNIGGKLWYKEKSNITKIGLIENVPASTAVRLYRITATGKLIIRKFVENVEQAHKNLGLWVSMQPQVEADRITKYIKQFCDFDEEQPTNP